MVLSIIKEFLTDRTERVCGTKERSAAKTLQFGSFPFYCVVS